MQDEDETGWEYLARRGSSPWFRSVQFCSVQFGHRPLKHSSTCLSLSPPMGRDSREWIGSFRVSVRQCPVSTCVGGSMKLFQPGTTSRFYLLTSSPIRSPRLTNFHGSHFRVGITLRIHPDASPCLVSEVPLSTSFSYKLRKKNI